MRRCDFGPQAGFSLHGRHIFFQLRCRQRTVRGGGDHLPQRLDAHIARSVNTFGAGLLRRVGKDIPLLVQRHRTLECIRRRSIAGEHEHAEGLLAFILRHLTGGGIFVPGIGQAVLAGHFLHHRVIQHGDFFVVFRLLRHGRGAGKGILADEDGHMAGKFREKYAFLCRRIAAADDENLFPGEELAVAGGAVGNTPALVRFLALESNGSRMCAGCQQDAKAAVVPLVGMHRLDIPGNRKAGGFRDLEFRAEALRLLPDGIRQRLAAGFGDAGIVDHLMGDGDLSAELLFFQHHAAVFRPGKIQRGGQPRRAAADNDHIVQIFHQS